MADVTGITFHLISLRKHVAKVKPPIAKPMTPPRRKMLKKTQNVNQSTKRFQGNIYKINSTNLRNQQANQ
jgi:hypothetical protein